MKEFQKTPFTVLYAPIIRREPGHGQKCDIFKVGEGVTECGWSDRYAGTIIEAGPKQIVWQRDKVTRLTEPKFVPGGFAAHCTNNDDIEYSYERDPEGEKRVFTLRKNGKWILKGLPMKSGQRLIHGRSEKYDYNF